jgi:hypothetical protein
MAKKCLRTRLSSVCTLRHHAIHRRPAAFFVNSRDRIVGLAARHAAPAI